MSLNPLHPSLLPAVLRPWVESCVRLYTWPTTKEKEMTEAMEAKEREMTEAMEAKEREMKEAMQTDLRAHPLM